MDALDIALASLTFLSVREKVLLRGDLADVSDLAALSVEDVSRLAGRTVRPIRWDGGEVCRAARQGLFVMERLGIRGVTVREADYPALLREIIDAPYMLFYRGDIAPLLRRCVSVVGTRRPCAEVAQATLDFAREASGDGVTVVSGFANGVDAWAHRGALAAFRAGAPAVTAAVLPCGIDMIVPVGNKKIAEYILKAGGCLVSEYVPGSPAEPWRFVQRNRIIAALSPATVVMQAPAGSGALITADFALDFNREVMFHQDGFCAAARRQDADARRKLCARGTDAARRRLRRDALRYVEDGAPVIRSYSEYVAAFRDAPGTYARSGGVGQLELFRD